MYLPVCVRTCRLRSKVSLKPFPQKLQRCLFVSLWHLTCRFNIRWWWKTFWHTCKQQLRSTKRSYERRWSLINRCDIPGTQMMNSDFELLIWSPWWHPVEQNWSSRQELAGSWQVSWRWEDGRKGQYQQVAHLLLSVEEIDRWHLLILFRIRIQRIQSINRCKHALLVSSPLFWIGRRSGCPAATSSSLPTSPRAELPGSAVVLAWYWTAARRVLAPQSSWWGRAGWSQLGWPQLPSSGWMKGRWGLQRRRGRVSVSLDCWLQIPEGNMRGLWSWMLISTGSVFRGCAVKKNSCPPQRSVQTLTVATTKATNYSCNAAEWGNAFSQVRSYYYHCRLKRIEYWISLLQACCCLTAVRPITRGLKGAHRQEKVQNKREVHHQNQRQFVFAQFLSLQTKGIKYACVFVCGCAH